MEKRQIPFPPNNSKKMKLDIPHNGYDPGPSTSNKDPFDDNTWDNEQIDEMILMASQACEVIERNECNIFTNNEMLDKSVSVLTGSNNRIKNDEPLRDIADYVLSFKPPMTSTQKTVVCQSGTFKTPQPTMINTQAGKLTMVTSSSSKTHIVDGSAHTMQELQAAMVRLDRLKYEHAQLQDNYLSKEGEVAILRSQLKSAQSQINAERIQKLKMEERKMAECNEKVNSVEKELRDMKTKMEFQDLEVSKLREKCRMLEKGSKIKLTQPTAPTPKPKWPSFSQKMDASILNESHIKRPPPDVQIKKSESYLPIQINVDTRKEYPLQLSIPECIFHHQPIKNIPIEYKSNREPLFVEHSSFMDIRRRILEDFRQNKSVRDESNCLSSNNQEKDVQCRVQFDMIYQDLTALGKMTREELKSSAAIDCALRICLTAKEYLLGVLRRLQRLSRRVNPQTVKEMDEVYLAYMTNNPDTMTNRNLYDDSSWCDNEQAIDTRRIIAVVAKICLHVSTVAEYICGLHTVTLSWPSNSHNNETNGDDAVKLSLLDLSLEICKKIEYTGCSQRYPGLLSAISMLIEHCVSTIDKPETIHLKIFDLCKCLLMLRPNGRCVVDVLKVFEKLSCDKRFLEILCKNGDSNTNVVVDYSQGVALCSSESCAVQLLCTQVEVWSSHLSVHLDTGLPLLEMTQCLLNLYNTGTHHDVSWTQHRQENKCLCCIRIYQCLTVCLHQVAKLYRNSLQYMNDDLRRGLSHALCSGLIMLKSSLIKDPDVIWRLKDYEGHYQMFIQILEQISDEMDLHSWHSEALTELKNTLALTSDVQKPDSPIRQLWEEMMEGFLLTD